MKLNLGCGRDLRKGYLNVDRIEIPHDGYDFFLWDLNNRPWPFAKDDSVIEVVMRDALEHLKIGSVIEIFDELWRVCVSGGLVVAQYPNASFTNCFKDPTHQIFLIPGSLDYLDPTTNLGSSFGHYTERKWKIVQERLLDFEHTIHIGLKAIK